MPLEGAEFLAAGRIPKDYVFVLRRRGRDDPHADELNSQLPPGGYAPGGCGFLAVDRIPDGHGLVLSHRDDPFAVRTVTSRTNRARIPLKSAEFFATNGIHMITEPFEMS